MDNLTKEARSAVMRRVRSKETKLETMVCAALRKRKIHFRRYGKVIGKPDFILRKKKVAIFIDSCFWHGCRWHCRMPKSRRKYWMSKIERNKRRDREVSKKLRSDGWCVIRIWEHRLRRYFDKEIDELIQELQF